MTFQTSDLIQDVPQNIPSGKLLKEAQKTMYVNYNWAYPLEQLQDEHGIYAYRYKDGVLVAKKKTMYDIVSVHRKVIARALEHNLNIYMVLGGIVYYVDPQNVIINKIKSNVRGEAQMINFNVRLLKRLS